MIRKITLICAASVALTVLADTTADAYQLLSPQRKWYNTPVMVEFNNNYPETSVTDGDYGKQAITASYFSNNGWNGTGAGTMLDGMILSRNAVQGDGRPTVQFNDPHGYCGGNCLAVTLTGFWHWRGGVEEIDDADIYFSPNTQFTSEREDPSAFWDCSAGEFYIEGVLQHELGHLLGLDHSGVVGATMYSGVSACDKTVDELGNDDRNGINALY